MKISTVSAFALILVSLTACKHKPVGPVTPPAAATPTPAAAVTESTDHRRPSRPEGTGRGDPAERAKARMEEIKAELALTPDQISKIQSLMDTQMASMQTLRADQSMDREQRAAKFRESRQAFGNQVAALLTPEQRTKWEEMQKKREAEMSQRRNNRLPQGGGNPPPPPANP